MKETLTLLKALKVNGTDRKKFDYDTELISGTQFLEADARAHTVAARIGKPNVAVVETDSSLHLYLGMMAIIVVNPEVDITDLERINGVDIIKITKIGRNFISRSAVEEEETENPDSEEKTLEELTEDTQEHTIQDNTN